MPGDGDGRSSGEPTPANRDHHLRCIGNLLKQLAGHGSLTVDDCGIIEGMDEQGLFRLGKLQASSRGVREGTRDDVDSGTGIGD
jgi:hypothetical protein